MTRIKNTYVAALAVLLIPMAANADPITQLITGTDVSGSFTYDDSTAVAGVGLMAGFVQYDITAFNFAFNDGTINESWILADLVSTLGGDFAVAVDNIGVWLFTGMDVEVPNWGRANFTNSGSATLTTFSILTFEDSWQWGTSNVEIRDANDVRAFRTYATSTSVPEPGTLALLGLGLAGIGFAKRKKA